MPRSIMIYKSVIHADNFTETMDGITTLIREMEDKPNILQASLCRCVMIMATIMIENVFWNAIKKFRKENELHKCCARIIDKGIADRIGVSKAMKEWPELIVGKGFDSSEPFGSAMCLIYERNQIVHSSRLSYYSHYIETLDGAKAAYYTALMSAKSIWKHFFGVENEIYNSFEKTFPPPEEVYFQKVLNYAKKVSIPYLEEKEFPKRLKTLNEYKKLSSKVCDDIVNDVFGKGKHDTITRALEICDYPIKVTELFKKSYLNLTDDLKESVLKKLGPLFRTLTKQKIRYKGGVLLGEVLPHVKLGIMRIRFKNHGAYMCIPVEEFLVIFIIDNSTIELTDIIKKD